MIKTLYLLLSAIFLLFFMGVCEVQAADCFQATCVRIIDGDTIDIVPDSTNKLIRVRLWGIDAPESNQTFGIHATQNLAQKILGEGVEISIVSSDMYGRLIGNVYCNGDYINRAMIADGCAWHYEKYAPGASDLEKAQENARNNNLGLWNTPTPTPPWIYRRAKQGSNVKMVVSPLIAAAAAGHVEIVSFLIQSGGDATGMSGELALFAAIQSGHTEVVKILLASGLDVSTENETYDENCVSLCLNENKLSGKCIRINDGDTIDISSIDGSFTKVHLYGIDAPELSQLSGIDSQQFLLNKIHGKNVEVELIGETTRGEHVAHVFCEGKSVNLQIVSEGWARAINETGNNSNHFFDAENEAIAHKLGIWGDFSHPVVSPHQFRRSQARINYTGSSAIYIAAANGNIEIAKLLQEYGVKINNDIGNKAISYAKESGNLDMVNFLIKNGAKEGANPTTTDFQIREIDTSGILPRASSIRENPYSLLRKQSSSQSIEMRHNNASPSHSPSLYTYNLTHTESEATKLIEAAATGDIEQVRKLVNKGVNPNITFSSFKLQGTKSNIAKQDQQQGFALSTQLNNQSNEAKKDVTLKAKSDKTHISASANKRHNTYSKQSKSISDNSSRSASSGNIHSKRNNELGINIKYVFFYVYWFNYSIYLVCM